MIKPKLQGPDLMNDIQQAAPIPGTAMIWWLGQSGYAIKTASTLIYADLYLSEHLTAKYDDTDKPHVRMTESPLRAWEIVNAAWVFSSHKHSDHLDPGTMHTLFLSSPGARLILPQSIADYAVKSLGLDRSRLLPTPGDETFSAGPMTVHSIPSAHPDLNYDETSGYPFQGFVIEVDGVTLYHSGDTILYEGLAERLKAFEIDVAFLPINGTDESRLAFGTPPNMSAQDAVNLGLEIGAKCVIPHHYDMFTFNTEDVAVFTRAADAAGLPYQVLNPGERFEWPARD